MPDTLERFIEAFRSEEINEFVNTLTLVSRSFEKFF